MVSRDKSLYDSLLQVALLAGLLRLQPDLGGRSELPRDGDLILGHSWAHVSAPTAHARLQHFASHKNVDNVIERYQEELFEELNALGRYNRRYASEIHAYQVLDGEAGAPPPPPSEPAAAGGLPPTRAVNDSDSVAPPLLPAGGTSLATAADDDALEEEELGRDLAVLPVAMDDSPPLDDYDNLWEMIDADLAAAGPGGPTDDPWRQPAEAEPWLAALPPSNLTEAAEDAWLAAAAAVCDAEEEERWWEPGPSRRGCSGPAAARAATNPRASFSTDASEDFIASGSDMSDEDAEAIEELLRQDEEQGLRRRDLEAADAADEDAGAPSRRPSETPEKEPPTPDIPDDALHDLWAGLHYSIDEETGEYVQRTPRASPSQSPPVSGSRQDRRRTPDPHHKVASRHASGEDSGQGSSAESETGEIELLDEMIQTVQRNPASSMQGRLPFARTMSMEQRWQDLASLLSLPAQEVAGVSHGHHQHLLAQAHHHHHHHHPSAGYAAYAGYGAPVPPPPPGPPAGPDMARSVLLHNASLAPPVGDLAANASYASATIGSVSHIGSAVVSSMNLTTDGLNAHVATSAASGDMMYYPSPAALASAPAPGASAPAPAAAGADAEAAPAGAPDGGFLSQILGVDELQLMEMPIADGHPEWVSPTTTDDPYSTPVDYAKASQAHRLYEYGGYRAAPGSPSAPGHPSQDSRTANLPVAQKKHQMYGKRYFQGADGFAGAAPPGAGALPPGPPSPAVPLKYPPYGAEGGAPAAAPFPPATPAAAAAAEAAAAGLDSPELKYSCSLDFMRGQPPVDRMGLVSHNHTYHLPPQAQGPSGIQRPPGRDKHGDRPREHLSRDEKRARAMNIPLTTDDIIHLPMDEFNERLSKHDLTEAQLSLIRDIRRRGKNKLAAQNCRKRKLDQILTLAEEVQRAKDQKQQTLADHQFLLQERARVKDKYSQLYRHVFQSLRDPDGNPYSPLEYSLQQSADGSILLVPRNTTSGATVEPDPAGGARRKQRDLHKPE